MFKLVLAANVYVYCDMICLWCKEHCVFFCSALFVAGVVVQSIW